MDTATWRSGYAAACKAVYTGSIPVVASETVPGSEAALVSRRVDPSWRRSLDLQQAVALADQPLERDRARRDCTLGRFGTSEVPNLTRVRRVRLTQTTRGRFGPRVVLNLPVVADLRCRQANKTCPDGQTVVRGAGSSV